MRLCLWIWVACGCGCACGYRLRGNGCDKASFLLVSSDNMSSSLSVRSDSDAPLGKQRLLHDIPYALVVLKQYLFKFNGAQYEGIFANGSVQNISCTTQFVEGIVSKVDVNGVKKLVETGKLKQHKFKVSSRMEE
eukprot:852377_1